MMKIFALLSILLFAFKAVFAQDTTSLTAEAITLQHLKKECDDGNSESCTQLKKARDAQLKKMLGEESEEKECGAYVDKFNASYKEFRKDQKTDAKEAATESREAKKDAEAAQKTCDEDIQDIRDKITAEDKKLKPALDALEEEYKKLGTEKDGEVQKLITQSKDLADAILRNENTERDALKLKYDTDIEKLTTECETNMLKAREAAKAYLEGRRQSRNSGRTQYRSVNSNSNKNPDEQEAMNLLDRTYASCQRQEQLLLANAVLAEKTLNETLGRMKRDQLDLINNLETLNAEIAKLPGEKLQKQNEKIAEITAALKALQAELAAKQRECLQKTLELKREAESIKSGAKEDRDDAKDVISEHGKAVDNCCTKNDKGTVIGTLYPKSQDKFCKRQKEFLDELKDPRGRR